MFVILCNWVETAVLHFSINIVLILRNFFILLRPILARQLIVRFLPYFLRIKNPNDFSKVVRWFDWPGLPEDFFYQQGEGQPTFLSRQGFLSAWVLFTSSAVFILLPFLFTCSMIVGIRVWTVNRLHWNKVKRNLLLEVRLFIVTFHYNNVQILS